MIAIIDDDESIRIAVEHLIESYGYSAASFDSAENFLDNADFDSMSCIISDIHMPGISGIALYRILRAQNILTPIIFITAFLSENVHQVVLSGNAVELLAKPFRSNELIEKIEAALYGPATD